MINAQKKIIPANEKNFIKFNFNSDLYFLNKMKTMKPSVFVSYSWDNQEHMNWVCKLAMDLRNNGVEARLDQLDQKLFQHLARPLLNGAKAAIELLNLMLDSSLKV